MLCDKKVNALPSHESLDELCNRVSAFFPEKIRIIHEGLEKVQDTSFELNPDTPFVGTFFSDFSPLSEEEVSS